MKIRPTLGMTVVLVALAAWYLAIELPRKQQSEREAESAAALVEFPPEAVARLTVVSPEHTIDLRLVDTHWEMTSPVEDLADLVAVTTLLRSITDAEVDRRLPAEHLDRYGLDPPDFTITADDSTGGVLARIDVGHFTLDSRSAYARVDDGDVLLVSPGVRHYSKLEPEDFRFKKVVAFDRATVTAFTVTDPPGKRRWLRRGKGWITVARSDTIVGDPEKVEAILKRLRALRVLRFRDDVESTIASATRHIELEPGPPSPLIDLTFAPLDSSVALVHHTQWKRTAETRVDLDDIFPPMDALTDRHLLRFDASAIHRIEVLSPDTTVTLIRRGNDWGPPNAALGLFPAPRVAALVGQLGTAEHEGAVAEKPSAPEPLFRVVLSDAGDKVVDRFDCFKSAGGIVATGPSTGGYVRVSPATLDRIAMRLRKLRE